MLSTVERVIFLQGIDIFSKVSSEDLVHIAAITELHEVEVGHQLYREGDLADCMYVVIDGAIRVERGGEEVMVAKNGDAVGAWALFDDERRVVSATAMDESELLRIDKEDFIDLLSDHVQITQGIMKTIVKRLRSLMDAIQRP